MQKRAKFTYMGPVFEVYKGLVVIVGRGDPSIIRPRLIVCDLESILRWYVEDSWGLRDF